VQGMEIQLIDDTWHAANHKSFGPTSRTGAIFGVVAPNRLATKQVGAWTRLRVLARGRQVVVDVNDQTVVDANLDRYAHLLARHPGLKRAQGRIGLQSMTGRVEFRHIMVRELPRGK